MMATRLLIGLFSLTLFNGCASQGVWFQESKSLSECMQDIKDCKFEAIKSGYVNSNNDSLGVETAFRRIEIIKACMETKGYRLISRSEAEKLGCQISK